MLNYNKYILQFFMIYSKHNYIFPNKYLYDLGYRVYRCTKHVYILSKIKAQ